MDDDDDDDVHTYIYWQFLICYVIRIPPQHAKKCFRYKTVEIMSQITFNYIKLSFVHVDFESDVKIHELLIKR